MIHNQIAKGPERNQVCKGLEDGQQNPESEIEERKGARIKHY
jgi:hypothetical protein